MAKKQKKILSLIKKELYKWLQEDKNNYLPFTREQVDNLTIENIQRQPLLDQTESGQKLACFIVWSSLEVLISYDDLPNAQKEYDETVKWFAKKVIDHINNNG